jgi:hypothetical protein
VERGWQLDIVDPADPRSGRSVATNRDHYIPFTAPGIAQADR